jgi:DNA-binding response OmpR family regulator
MMPVPVRPKIAVINTSEDLTVLLQTFFEEEGFEVAIATVRVFRTGQEVIEQFLELHDPHVLVWDVALPYEENWQYFQKVRQSPCMRGRRFVLMSTNVQRVREVAGVDEDLIEIVGKPFDLQQLLGVIKRTLAF